VTRPTYRAVEANTAEAAYRRDLWRGRVVIAAALSLAGMVAAALVWVAPHIRDCTYATMDPALKGKAYICPDPDPGWYNDGD
jgi:hypothetical protein